MLLAGMVRSIAGWIQVSLMVVEKVNLLRTRHKLFFVFLFFLCVVGIPDSHRGSSQAGSAGTGAHVCTGARWRLFHVFRRPDARRL